MAEVVSLQAAPEAKPLNIDQVEAQLKNLKWPDDHKYGGKCCCKDYIKGNVPMRYVQPEKPKSYKPKSVYSPPAENFPTDTVYKRSYEPIDDETRRNCRPVGGAPRGNLTNCGPFSPNTTQRMSYGPIPNPEPAQRFYPHEYNLKGQGPMQDLTTHQHDYTPKPIQPLRPFKYQENIGLPETPMENRTTNRLSYMPIDLKCIDPPHSYRPTQEVAPSEPFPKDTIYKTSYLPTKPQPRVIRCPPVYMKPDVPMSGRTVYTGSFVPPGHFVNECEIPADDPGKGCYCIYPGECLVEKYKKAHDYSVQDKTPAADIK